MLFNPLDGILGSTAKVQILRALLPLTTPVSGREAQRMARVRSRRGTSMALDDLFQLGVLQRTETRGSHLYQVNREHELVSSLSRLFRDEEGRLQEFVSTIRAGLAARSLVAHVCSLILYGSNARRDATPSSDVDLLAMVDWDSVVAEVREALYDAGHELRRRQGLRISSYVLSVGRVRERVEAGDPLMGTIQKEGRLLMGETMDRVTARW